MFEYADKVIMQMNRYNLRKFNRLKTLEFDEMNVLQEVTVTYDTILKRTKKHYLDIAYMAYMDALVALGYNKRKAEKMADETITEDWILDMFEEYNPVTLYQFIPEFERKKHRTYEALMAAENKPKEVKKALKYWTFQSTHYADESVLRGTVNAYKDAGIPKVRWITMEDDRVCEECDALDGKVFRIDRIPPRPHYGCRCWIEAVR